MGMCSRERQTQHLAQVGGALLGAPRPMFEFLLAVQFGLVLVEEGRNPGLVGNEDAYWKFVDIDWGRWRGARISLKAMSSRMASTVC